MYMWLACEYRPALGEANCSSGAPAAESVRFYGTTGLACAVANRCDRIRVPVDPPTPADVGAGSFTVEFWLRGNRADNALFGTFRAGDTTATNTDWTQGNVVVDRNILGTVPAGGGDWGASIHRSGDVNGAAGQGTSTCSPLVTPTTSGVPPAWVNSTS